MDALERWNVGTLDPSLRAQIFFKNVFLRDFGDFSLFDEK